jgi:uncharacterized protein (UPF0333 family)
MFSIFKKKFWQKGAMALSSILVLAMILLAVGLAMASSSFIQSSIVSNQNKSISALYIAEAGAKDAMQKLTRNKNYSNTGYNLAIGNGSAGIVVSKDTPSSGQTEILSTGVVGGNTKKIKVILNTDAAGDGSGKVAIISWEEVGS